MPPLAIQMPAAKALIVIIALYSFPNSAPPILLKLNDASMKGDAFLSDCPLRPVADGAHSHRQCAHRAIELALRLSQRRGFHLRFDDTDLERSRRNMPARLKKTLPGWAFARTSCGNSRSVWLPMTRPSKAEGDRARCPAMNDGGTGPPPQGQQPLDRPPIYDRGRCN